MHPQYKFGADMLKHSSDNVILSLNGQTDNQMITIPLRPGSPRGKNVQKAKGQSEISQKWTT